jgi:class 3 adenylate cyclase
MGRKDGAKSLQITYGSDGARSRALHLTRSRSRSEDAISRREIESSGDRRDNPRVTTCAQCGARLPSDARFCPACAASVDRAPEPAEERKLATVLFADLVGSTAIGGSQDPERTRVMLNRFYDAMAAEIEQAGGTVEKFVGDAVMAAFGAPAALEDHGERALHAALTMQRRLKELFGERLALRIGVNTGEVVVGRPREGSSFVTGDAVNVGARLEQAAAPGEILVGERTAAAVRGAFELGEPMTIEAKGKPDGLICRRLVRALTLMRPRGVGGLRSAFVGRERELAELRAAYERGQPRLAAVVGDAGVGKSRLMRELWAWLAEQEPQPLQRTGRCLSYGHGTAYWPLAEVLREHFGILDTDPPDVIAERLGVRRYLGLTLGLDPGEELHPLKARERLHDAWAEFLSELVRERRVVLLVEDVHWADDELLDLLDALVAQVDGPLLLLVTARPELLERRPAWNRDALLLDALPPAAAGLLVDELLGAELPASVRDVVIERAEGNPFFVEELLATLIDRGVLQRRNGRWLCAELPAGFEIPDTVQAVLAARIDLLPPAEKAALQAAAVIGRVFWTGPVYELVGGMPDFDVLAERDFVRRRAGSTIPGEREYAIKHALTREVAYDSVPKAKRGQLHAAFASWIEHAGQGRDDHAALLAHHYAEAVRPEDVDLAWPGQDEQIDRLRAQAVAWSERAAQLAIGRYEIDDAMALLHRAVALESEPGKRAQLWLEIGRANALRFDGDALRAALEQAIMLTGPSAELYTELALQTARRTGMWKRPPDREVVDAWIDRALELAEEGSPTHARALAALALWRKDEQAARKLHAIARRLGDIGLLSNALAALTDVAWSAGDLDEARMWLEERLGLLPDLVDPDDRHFALMTAVSLYLTSGKLAESVRASEFLDEMVQGLTPHHRLHGVATRISVETFRGGWARVRELTEQAERAVKANSAAPCPSNASCLFNCALASVRCGDEDEAARLEAEADAEIRDVYRAHYSAAKLRLALARNNLRDVKRLVSSFELGPFGWMGGIDAVPALFDALVVLGERDRIEAEAAEFHHAGAYIELFALRALGVARGDEQLLEQASSRFREMGLDWRADETDDLFRERIAAKNGTGKETQ